MTIETIRCWGEIDNLSSEWSQLVNMSPSPSIFVSWEWVDAWRRSTGEEARPYLIAVRDDSGRLIGLAPLYESAFVALGFVRFRVLRMMADVATGAEYADWIVHREFAAEASAAIAGELARNRREWDLVWLSNVAGWTGVEGRINQPCGAAGFVVRTRPRYFGSVSLPADLESFEMSIPARRRQQMRRNFRKFENMSDIRFVRCDSAERLPEFLEALFDLHQKRWQHIGRDGCFRRRPAEAEFYREFAKTAFDRGWLAILAARDGDEFRAVQFGYLCGNTYLQLQEGYDPDFQSGVGNALRYYSIMEFIDEGIEEYDFLTPMTEHKRRWNAVQREGTSTLIGSGSLKSRALIASGLWPSGRFIEQQGIDAGWSKQRLGNIER